MEAILDFSGDLNISLLDQVVTTFYRGSGPEKLQAQKILTQFQEHPEAWKRADAILEKSQVNETRFLALQVLETLIKTMWKALPPVQANGIKDFIVAFVIKMSSTEESLHQNRTLISKLNLVLVQILKQEWPHNWPNFIPEIVAASKSNLSLCENNMRILRLLSEEIFDFGAEQMTQQKAHNLKNQMCAEFSSIFQLCHEILQKAAKPSLIKATLATLHRFLNWIPLGYIFETDIISILHSRFLSERAFRNITLKCLTEIGALDIHGTHDDRFVLLFNMTLGSVVQMLPTNTNIPRFYEEGSDDDEQFLQNLALFLTSFMSTHLLPVETIGAQDPNCREMLMVAHHYLLCISQIPEQEIFKICLEYWTKLVTGLYEELINPPPASTDPLLQHNSSLVLAGSVNRASGVRRMLYTDVLHQLRIVFIERMVKPKEVLITENDEGEIVRVFVKESDTIVLYKSMREALVYLTHLGVDDMIAIMNEKLARQMDNSEWSWDNLNKLCWAIGSISGAMNEEIEKNFLVKVIKELLTLTELRRGKDNKAVVASNIMYVVGQYPRFLKAHWKFLKTVVNKLFEFMHELHEGVQDMACDTFIKIAQECKRHFVTQQQTESQPYVDEIINDIDRHVMDLRPQQVQTFYEAVGYMIRAAPSKQASDRMVESLMRSPNAGWDSLMAEATQRPDILSDPEKIKMLGNILKTNVSACTSIGGGFLIQIGRNYMDMLGLYRAVSGLISQAVASEGLIATKTPRVRGMRTIKKEILKLVETFVVSYKAPDLESIMESMIPPLLETVLVDYQRNVEDARDAEVLSVMASIITRLSNFILPQIPPILDSVFQCTLNMISQDFEEYPEHRHSFFLMLQAINTYCFPALLQLPSAQFKLYMDSIVWAFKHTMRDISDMGLSIVTEMLTNFSKTEPSVANAFFQTYYLSLLQDIFFVLTNPFHKSGFRWQTVILSQLFTMVSNGTITQPLYDPTQVTRPNMSNQEFLTDAMQTLLANAFPHVQPVKIAAFVQGLFVHCKDFPAFKGHVRDFLVTLKEFSGEEGADGADKLFLEEREAELEQRKQAELQAALRIPGMVKPSDRPDTEASMQD
ncbi:hypothetical protein CXG81DRAFT_9513 [Caulochytrium protostelioides]|uniref:Nuclear export receptor Crm1 n=1 Tax=Caulochytrium protostelioides TaxID=1555241 RepID=A0A4P9XD55_9FUNG|nr:nuclear export receptor Crm1 [Caulochytrium protostelioides]RKP03426.1 hypothetical protein CXG81DRAFT_9513 [Caulochytrium protostelioides]|eukprot:RKP03426.1 hypothetical protein CXG81DRAFT_9513 [Caulochytrium protostelioides]